MVYRVRYYVDTPVIVNAPIHLDGVLAAVHPAMHNLGGINRFSGRNNVITAPLPLDSAKIDKTWVWCATAADYAPGATAFTDKFDKRKDALDYHYISRRQTPRTGPGRDRMETVYGVACEYVQFWASSANLGALRRICARVKHIGNLRKMGYGNVHEMQITESERIWKECLILNGIAVRNLPGQLIETGEKIVEVQTVSPYWLPDNLIPGCREGDRCALKAGVYLNEYHRN